ncbi:MAG: hypothetical protein QF491_00390 [Alphaproteobacteria bacterium]|nr:hypothetical protein [Alphaproteobacteria bacterium]
MRLAVAGLVLAPAGAALAHTSERAFILLLPTRLYLIGGGLAVALSFVVMALVPTGRLRALAERRWHLVQAPTEGMVWSAATLLILAGLLVAGLSGSRDPLANPLPLAVWTVWWIGLTFLHVVFGNLWAVINPWRAAYWLLTALPPLRRWREAPPLAYSSGLGYWPAVLGLLAFAWFELVHPAPHDPAVLTAAVLVYGAVNLVGMLLFGAPAWLRQGETFAVFFRLVSWLAPLGTDPVEDDDRKALTLTLPALRLLRVGELPSSGMVFVLLALASVSFDGLSRTFWWLDLIGVNPFKHPGRTELIAVNSLGLLAVVAVFIVAYATAVLLGRALAGGGGKGAGFGRLVVSIVPIAFAYHFAHYLSAFMVDGQYMLRTLSDPLAQGLNLFGTAEWHVTTSFLAHHHSVELIWNLQVAVIVVAHVMAVAIAHVLALAGAAGKRQAVLSQLPMTALMVGYTVFGLWLLATPAIG